MDPKKVVGIRMECAETPDSASKLDPTPIMAQERTIEPPNYDWLAPSLRRIYDDVLNEPIPESFIELLKQLHNREKRK